MSKRYKIFYDEVFDYIDLNPIYDHIDSEDFMYFIAPKICSKDIYDCPDNYTCITCLKIHQSINTELYALEFDFRDVTW